MANMYLNPKHTRGTKPAVLVLRLYMYHAALRAEQLVGRRHLSAMRVRVWACVCARACMRLRVLEWLRFGCWLHSD